MKQKNSKVLPWSDKETGNLEKKRIRGKVTSGERFVMILTKKIVSSRSVVIEFFVHCGV